MNKQNPRLEILRDEASWNEIGLRIARNAYFSSARNPVVRQAPPPDILDLPVEPSYNEDLAEWLAGRDAAHAGSHKPAPISADQAQVWNGGPPAVAGVYESLNHFGANNRHWDGSLNRHWDGSLWSVYLFDGDDPQKEQRLEAHVSKAVLWRRLIEADKPADTAAPAAATPAAAKYSVCIKAHHGVEVGEVGRVTDGNRILAYPECWLPCDKNGWVTHERGGACLVRCLHEVKLATGEVGLNGSWAPDAPDDRRIVAWRPTGALPGMKEGDEYDESLYSVESK